jgi:hypothetical protein
LGFEDLTVAYEWLEKDQKVLQAVHFLLLSQQVQMRYSLLLDLQEQISARELELVVELGDENLKGKAKYVLIDQDEHLQNP